CALPPGTAGTTSSRFDVW
nr:immunoglobulin heavy chain junction region [Macaca mulatta]